MFFEMNNLSFRYKNAKQDVIDGLSISIEKGEIVGILGKSGSGKSTLLRLIAGLEYPSSGSIEIKNKTIVDDEHFLVPEKREVGMVFQDYALFPHLTVEKNIKFGLHHFPKSEQKNRLLHMLELIDLKGFEKRYPYELSGGQQQRVALARALAPNPSILLMDEPFSNLDADLRGKIRQELKNILKKEGMTCIFVTHDREDVNAICDRVINME
ncbi:ABC transporter ATP-binding protein [Bacillus cereus group sp. BfR-BA-01310]|uniref:ABC transporter ATP-binding protein n=1 Tax=Bacillus cereus group sp. BfR-BA-01310 TaxID=2920287 RepID=UPI001F576BEF|nr:ABC transporter ATP-binding protein [Bacillus cereus group sp. BfR-BA-01310]